MSWRSDPLRHIAAYDGSCTYDRHRAHPNAGKQDSPGADERARLHNYWSIIRGFSARGPDNSEAAIMSDEGYVVADGDVILERHEIGLGTECPAVRTIDRHLCPIVAPLRRK